MPHFKYVGDTTKIKPFRLKAGGLRIPKGDSKKTFLRRRSAFDYLAEQISRFTDYQKAECGLI